ncbi:MAG: FAD/NAD(P)-binding oxidoreductase [Betaproteobacteria bacterium]
MTLHDVIVVGGGPAGLAAAVELKRLGIRDVVVLERDQSAGGTPRHCAHRGFGWKEFRRALTGPGYARRLVNAAAGIEIRTGTTALALEHEGRVRVLTPHGLETIAGRRVVLALGMRETPRAARLVSGTQPWGVFTAGELQRLVHLARLKPCTRAVIVGSGLVSFLCLPTLRRAGIKPVALLEPGETVLAPRPGRWIARLLFGARVRTQTRVVAVHGTSRVTGVEIERNGRHELLACDGIVFSGEFVPESGLVQASHLEIDRATGGPRVDQYGRCSDPTYFAAGNLLRAAEPAWTAWREGRSVAHVVAASVHGALPEAQRFVTLEARAPLRYICPQRFALPAPLPAALPFHARADGALRGRLRVMRHKHELWGQDQRVAPERRICVPLEAGSLDSADHLVVECVERIRS